MDRRLGAWLASLVDPRGTVRVGSKDGLADLRSVQRGKHGVRPALARREVFVARSSKCLAVVASLAGAVALFSMVVSAAEKAKSAAPAMQTAKMPPPAGLKRACANPAAAEIKFEVVSRDPATRWKGLVRITGLVKNIGPKASANVFYIQLRTPAAVLASQKVTGLAPGALAQVVKQMNWESSSPSEGEFPPKITLSIVRDIDLPLDDCNLNDNTLERNGADINTLLKS
jgi:hypothetical protein